MSVFRPRSTRPLRPLAAMTANVRRSAPPHRERPRNRSLNPHHPCGELSSNYLGAEELLQLVEHFRFEIEIAQRQQLDLGYGCPRVPTNAVAGALHLPLPLRAAARGEREEIDEAMRADAEE